MTKILVSKLASELGPSGWIPGRDAQKWARDWLDRFGVQPLGVARPRTTKDVSMIVEKCAEAGVKVIPQGGNTGLVGGSVTHAPDQIIISMERMNGIETLSDFSESIVVEAGAVLGDLHNRLAETDQMFPMHLGSEGSAQIGGLIATNAGGIHAFRFGMMQDLVLGIEVVLPDGSIFDGMRSVQKDNTGYQLRKLFCGSEGTLGIVTRAVLKLAPRPKQSATALLSVKSLAAAVRVARHFRTQIGEFLTAIEFFSETGLSFALKNIPNLIYPLETRSPCYVLIEAQACSKRVPLQELVEEILETEMTNGNVLDGAMASSVQQSLEFWRIREEQPEGQKRNGPQLKHDISVPPDRLAEFLALADETCARILPRVRTNPFGHLGDGNVHYNLSPPLDAIDFSNKETEIGRALYRLAVEMKGSFAAEHGVGHAKLGLSNELRNSVENRLMDRIKISLDPELQLNPGVLV